VTALELSQVRSGPILMADARLASGLTLVIGEGRTASSRLVELASGVERPAQGRVLLDGSDPYASPSLRRSIASLLGVERLPLSRTVATALDRVLVTRGDDRRAPQVLDEAGLSTWAGRRPLDLDATEQRALAAVIALSHRRARLVALAEPFRIGSAVSADFVRDALRRHSAAGAVVLVALADPEPLRALSAQRLELRGGFLGPARPGLGLFQGSVALQATTSEPHRLVRALAEQPGAAGVRWDERSAPGVVVVLGTELEALAAIVSQAAAAAGVTLEALVPATLPVPERPAAAPQHYSAWPAAHGAPVPGLPPLAAPRTPDQSVGMPSTFADPTRPGGGGESR
jgi:ABC-type thiamine transport system ATPase subunit